MLTALVNRQRSTSIAPCVERLRDASALMIRLMCETVAQIAAMV